jgi:hypothetical protein
VASYGQCRASLRSGDRCRVVILTEGAEFCPHHLRLAEEFGAEMVRSGAVPKKRARPVAELPVATAMTNAASPAAIAAASVPMLAD